MDNFWAVRKILIFASRIGSMLINEIIFYANVCLRVLNCVEIAVFWLILGQISSGDALSA